MVVMKKILGLLVLVLTLTFVGCGGDSKERPSEGVNVEGEWQLVDIILNTKSATIGGETVSVYVSFAKGGSFKLWQQLGEGRYRSYTGTWVLTEDTLGGTYSDGKPWGSTYTVSVDGDELTMETAAETFTYSRCVIPDSIKSQD